MTSCLTAKMARRLARNDINPLEMANLILTAVRAEILSASITGATSIGADYSGMDQDKKLIEKCVNQAARVLQKDGYEIKIEGGAGFHIDWSKPPVKMEKRKH